MSKSTVLTTVCWSQAVRGGLPTSGWARGCFRVSTGRGRSGRSGHLLSLGGEEPFSQQEVSGKFLFRFDMMGPAECLWGNSVITGAARPLTHCTSSLFATAEGFSNSGSEGVWATTVKEVSGSCNNLGC